VKEQSHKDEMSAALRGDFARLRGRGVAVALAPTAESAAHEASEPSASAAPVLEPERETTVGLEPAQSPTVGDEDDDGSRVEPGLERSGWFDRLLGR
jgi:hypothetical protein